MAILEIEDLVAGYDSVPILEDVSLSLEEGKKVGVIGPNGAGKSTLFKTIMGYLTPWEGTIQYRSEDISGIEPSQLVEYDIGYVPQERNIFPKMSVEENLRIGGYLVDSDRLQGRLDDVYELFPRLSNRKSQTVRTMSGGEQKMVAIARAMITEPDLLLFDEPSAGLMPKYTNMVFDKIDEINHSRDVSFLIIEQDIKELLENTDETYVLRDGTVRLHMESADLLGNEELGEAYLGGEQ